MSRDDKFKKFSRSKTALKFYLIGKNYHKALKALGYAERFTTGFRKDGITPALYHQVSIALNITQLKHLEHEETCIALALLHDIQEDHDIDSKLLTSEFGFKIAEKTWKLTKAFQGDYKKPSDYINQIALDLDCSIVKGCDRINNLSSMFGVFDHEKMTEYVAETREIFLPMIKKASKVFPEQQLAYQTISEQLKLLIDLAEHNLDLQESVDQAVDHDILYQLKQLTEDLENTKVLKAKADAALKDALKVKTLDSFEVFNKLNRILSTNHKQFPAVDKTIRVEILKKLQEDLGISQLELIDFSNSKIDAV